MKFCKKILALILSLSMVFSLCLPFESVLAASVTYTLSGAASSLPSNIEVVSGTRITGVVKASSGSVSVSVVYVSGSTQDTNYYSCKSSTSTCNFSFPAGKTGTYKIYCNSSKLIKTFYVTKSSKITSNAIKINKYITGLSTHTVGNTFSLSNYKLSSDSYYIYGVEAMIINSAGEVVQQIAASNNTQEFSLSGTINTNMKFGQLAVGHYTLHITAVIANSSSSAVCVVPCYLTSNNSVSYPFDVVGKKPTITATGMKAPEALVKGEGFGLRGVLTTDCGVITSVVGMVVPKTLYDNGDTDSSTLLASYDCPVATVFNLSTTSYDLKGTVNSELKFGELNAGSYVYIVRAEAINGGTKGNYEFTQEFTVASKLSQYITYEKSDYITSGAVYSLANRESKNFLTVNKTVNYTEATGEQLTSVTNKSQRFRFTYVSDGAYKIKLLSDEKKVLSVNGNYVGIYDDNGADCQLWYVVRPTNASASYLVPKSNTNVALCAYGTTLRVDSCDIGAYKGLWEIAATKDFISRYEKSLTLNMNTTTTGQVQLFTTNYNVNRNVTYTSSNTNVASVNSDGKITANACGTTIIKMIPKVDESRYSLLDVTVTGGGTVYINKSYYDVYLPFAEVYAYANEMFDDESTTRFRFITGVITDAIEAMATQDYAGLVQNYAERAANLFGIEEDAIDLANLGIALKNQDPDDALNILLESLDLIANELDEQSKLMMELACDVTSSFATAVAAPLPVSGKAALFVTTATKAILEYVVDSRVSTMEAVIYQAYVEYNYGGILLSVDSKGLEKSLNASWWDGHTIDKSKGTFAANNYQVDNAYSLARTLLFECEYAA